MNTKIVRLFCYLAAGLFCSTSAIAQTEAVAVKCMGTKNTSKGVCSGGVGPGECWSVPVSSSETVSVVIGSEGGRIRIPVSLFKSGGDGWFVIGDLKSDEQFIDGRIKLSANTKAKLKMDRVAGTIDIQSSSYLGSNFNFSGSCEKADLQTRKF